MVKYIGLPINLLYTKGSSIGLSSLRISFKLGSTGNVVRLLPKKPILSGKGKVYFLLLEEISLLDLAISKPSKYLREPIILV